VLSALATWLVAVDAYYYALRGERVAVVAPICRTDPLWTALFAWAILGSAFGGLTLAGMAGALAAAAHGDVLPGPAKPGRGRPAGGRGLGALLPLDCGDRPDAHDASHGDEADLHHLFGVVFLRERIGPRLALAAVATVAGVMLAALDGLR